MGSEDKTWVKLGVTIASKPGARGRSLAVNIPRKIVEAYDLWNAEMVEFTIDRVLKPAKAQEVTA